MTTTTHTIDAKGKKLGRVASEAAVYLMGKKQVGYSRNTVADVNVTITNASQADISEKKMKEVEYETYSGYPGGLKKETLGKVITDKGYSEAFKIAVYGMLPGNKLRKQMMKNLTVTE